MLMFPWFNPNGRGGAAGGSRAFGAGSGSASESSQPLADYVAPSPEWSESLQLQAESYYSNSKGLSVKARAVIILGFLLLVTMAFGQGPDSFVYVKQFPGNDVGTKVANAQKTCTTNTVITCYLAIDPSLVVMAPGTMPSLCSHCVLYDWRAGIPGGFNGSSVQSLDPTHLPVTQNGAVADLNLTSVDKLDQANTHLTGNQLVLTGGSGNVGRKVQGNGVSTANVVSSYQYAGGSITFNATVTPGEWVIIWNTGGGCNCPPDDSTLGNTFSTIAIQGSGGGSDSTVYASHITHGGADTFRYIHTGHFPNEAIALIVQGLPSSAVVDTSYIPTPPTSQATTTATVTTTAQIDMLLAFSTTHNGNCAVTAPSGYTALPGATDTQTEASFTVVTTPGSYSATFGFASGGGNCSSAVDSFGVIAFKVAGLYSQSADLDQWLDSLGDVLSHVDASGEFNPPQSAGVPATTPAYGSLVYDTNAQCTRVYDAVAGWECLTAAGTGLTVGTNGYYRIDPDGTIFAYVNTGSLNNNTPTTVSLPHSFPSLIASIVCSDNGGRVQAGNDQNVGANVVGLTAPYSSIYVDTPATGMSAYCVVVGK